MARNADVHLSTDLLKASYRSTTFPQEWTLDQRRASLDRYRKWLRLKQLNPKRRMAPTRDIDEFWHLHTWQNQGQFPFIQISLK